MPDPLPEDARTIRTDRLILTAATGADGHDMYGLLTHPDMRHVGNVPPSPEAMSHDLARADENSRGEQPTSYWWAARHADDGRLVAAIRTDLTTYEELSRSGPPATRTAVEFTTYVDHASQRDGHGTNVYEALLAHLKMHVEIGRVEFRVHHTNLAGQAAAKKLGAHNTGISSCHGYEVWRLDLR